jgi:hypothetical protein
MTLRTGFAILLVAFLAIPGAAFANLTLHFTGVTGNNEANVTTGQAQLSVTVEDIGSGKVLFTFANSGDGACSITDVYFEDGTLLHIADIVNAEGVSFSQGASPGNLPGSNGLTVPFTATAEFAADSDPAVQPNGVNPEEQLGIEFELKTVGDNQLAYRDVIGALLLGLTDPDDDHALRIGIRVQGFAGGGSESFINRQDDRDILDDILDPPVVPAPGAAALGFVGLGLVGWVKRRIA